MNLMPYYAETAVPAPQLPDFTDNFIIPQLLDMNSVTSYLDSHGYLLSIIPCYGFFLGCNVQYFWQLVTISIYIY